MWPRLWDDAISSLKRGADRQVSPVWLANQVRSTGKGARADREDFLEELIVCRSWR
jgi:hypothetical protein